MMRWVGRVQDEYRRFPLTRADLPWLTLWAFAFGFIVGGLLASL